jgi:hypothetical protein
MPEPGVWTNERCQHHQCDEAEQHDPKCKDWPSEWAEVERIRDLPEVDEALLSFKDDCTGDNAAMVVRAVMRAARGVLGTHVADPKRQRELAQERAAGVTACHHTDTRQMQTGDGTPVEFCPECGRNVGVALPDGGQK